MELLLGLFSGGQRARFIIEVIVFYRHLVDRLAFTHFGPANREKFGDQFIVAVVKEVLREWSREFSAEEFLLCVPQLWGGRLFIYASSRSKSGSPELLA